MKMEKGTPVNTLCENCSIDSTFNNTAIYMQNELARLLTCFFWGGHNLSSDIFYGPAMTSSQESD